MSVRHRKNGSVTNGTNGLGERKTRQQFTGEFTTCCISSQAPTDAEVVMLEALANDPDAAVVGTASTADSTLGATFGAGGADETPAAAFLSRPRLWCSIEARERFLDALGAGGSSSESRNEPIVVSVSAFVPAFVSCTFVTSFLFFLWVCLIFLSSIRRIVFPHLFVTCSRFVCSSCHMYFRFSSHTCCWIPFL